MGFVVPFGPYRVTTPDPPWEVGTPSQGRERRGGGWRRNTSFGEKRKKEVPLIEKIFSPRKEVYQKSSLIFDIERI